MDFSSKIFYPGQNGQYSLGTINGRWKDLYLSGKLYVPYIAATNDMIIEVGNNKALKPSWDAHYNLGDSSYKWKDGYFSGNVYAQNTPIQWYGTQAEYDALGTYDSNTIYNILES